MAEITILVLGLDDKNHAALQQVPGAERYRFLPLLDIHQLQDGEIAISELLDEASRVLDRFEGRIDGIIGYWDFPVSMMVPILCRRRGLRSAPLDAVVRCEHKYWSRLEQQKVIDEIPRFGLVDSINYPDSPVFLRHQYPSQLPGPVVQRLREISERVIKQMGLDNSTFGVEFFYDHDTEQVNLLEINPRHSQSHAELFKDVDGFPNHHVVLSLALGQDPRLPSGEGPYSIAAKCYHRRFRDGVVRRVPTPAEIERIQREIPGVAIHPVLEEGQRLSDLPAQDSYSYELTDIIVGARDEAELVDKYERTVAALCYEFDDDEGR